MCEQILDQSGPCGRMGCGEAGEGPDPSHAALRLVCTGMCVCVCVCVSWQGVKRSSRNLSNADIFRPLTSAGISSK